MSDAPNPPDPAGTGNEQPELAPPAVEAPPIGPPVRPQPAPGPVSGGASSAASSTTVIDLGPGSAGWRARRRARRSGEPVAVTDVPSGAVDHLPRPRLRLLDLLNEAVAGVLARPMRAALTTLGTVLGVAALVATLGVSKTAGNQIVGRFDELTATQVVVEPTELTGAAVDDTSESATASLPWDAEARLRRLRGVVAAGSMVEVSVGSALARSVPVDDPLQQTAFQIPVIGVTPGVFRAVRGTMYTGRFVDAGDLGGSRDVVVLGREAARKLGVLRIDNQPAVFIGDDLYTVVGIVDSVRRQTQLERSILLPATTAERRFGSGAPDRVVIETSLGAAQLIARQAPVALSPNTPDQLRVSAPADPRSLRKAVEGDVNSLFLVLGLVSLVVGAIGIANVTLVTVIERVGEIGLRRALGAARRHIALQFLVESTAMGAVGGVIGASLGTIVIVSVSAARSWTPVLDGWIPIAAPALGAAVGLLAGLYPSWRAAKLEPVEALRSSL